MYRKLLICVPPITEQSPNNILRYMTKEAQKMKRYLTALMVITLLAFVFVVNVQAQKARAAATETTVVQQPLYTDFRGAKLGMTPEQVREKLGTPVLKDAEMDYYVLSDTITAQVVFDANHQARMISVDYANGAGAPDYRTVVGQELTTREDGSAFTMVRYESKGFWVSYSRTAGPVTVVTVTIQKI
jgi:outer membrane protein assembly factor BamE (lipoprotein component of BamABCDE complex)